MSADSIKNIVMQIFVPCKYYVITKPVYKVLPKNIKIKTHLYIGNNLILKL